MTYRVLRAVMTYVLCFLSVGLLIFAFLIGSSYIVLGDYSNLMSQVRELAKRGPIDLTELPSSLLKDEIKFLRVMVPYKKTDTERFEHYIEEGLRFRHWKIVIFKVLFSMFVSVGFLRFRFRKNKYKDEDRISLKNSS